MVSLSIYRPPCFSVALCPSGRLAALPLMEKITTIQFANDAHNLRAISRSLRQRSKLSIRDLGRPAKCDETVISDKWTVTRSLSCHMLRTELAQRIVNPLLLVGLSARECEVAQSSQLVYRFIAYVFNYRPI